MSLRARLAILAAVLVALASSLAAAASYASTRAELRTGVDQFLTQRVDRIVALPGAGRPDRNGGPTVLPGGPRRFPGGELVADADALTQLVDGDGTVVAALETEAVLPVDRDELAVVLSTGDAELRDVEVGGTPYRMITAPVNDQLVVQVGRSLAEVERALDALGRRLVLTVIAVAVAGAAAGWWLARLLTRPLASLAATATSIARTEDLATPITVPAGGEVGAVAAAFSHMLGALDASRRQQRTLVQDAGHELRTPLTTLRTSMDLLELPDLPPEDRATTLRTAREELDQLTTLVGEIVELGTDSRRDDPARPCDLREIADTVAERARRRHGRPVEVVGAAAAPVVAQPARIERAITNLVDNAVKFSPEDAPVTVTVGEHGIDVADRGPGVPDEDLPRIFDRFHRSVAARSLPGSGLGLAIVAQIAADHGGAVHAANAPDGGAVVGFTVGFSPNSYRTPPKS